jgi:hypothetical protein
VLALASLLQAAAIPIGGYGPELVIKPCHVPLPFRLNCREHVRTLGTYVRLGCLDLIGTEEY